MKPLFLRIGAVAASAALMCCLFGCSSAGTAQNSVQEESPIYLPSVIRQYQSSSVVEASFSYDEYGNLVSLTENRVSGSGTHIDLQSGEATEYDSKVVSDNYVLSLGENGLPTQIEYWQESSEGGTDRYYADISVSVDDQGRITEYAVQPDDGSLISEDTMLVSYGENGGISSISNSSSNFTSVYFYDEAGWKTHGQTVGGYTGSTDTEYTLVKDASGEVKGLQYPSFGGGSGSYSYEYDEAGNISVIYCDGDKRSEIEYILIENPSSSARAFSLIKIDSGIPLEWVPFS